MIGSQLAMQKIFEGLPRIVVDEIRRRGRCLRLNKGDILMREGDPVRSLYCILEGEVDIFVPEDMEYQHDMNWLNLLVDGACVGEYSFIDQQPASATVRANTEVSLFEVSHEVLRELLDTDDAARARLYKNLLECLVDRLRNTNVYIDYLQRNRTSH